MVHIVFDLEATCWKEDRYTERMEIIEIGAAKLDPVTFDVISTFDTFVRPLNETKLSDFCRELTCIRQEDVDTAPLFPQAFGAFLDWIGEGEVVLCSWGAYDMKQLRMDLKRHGMIEPPQMREHINLKQMFAERFNRKPCGMKRALDNLKIPLEGVHHRGMDDALNISKLAKILLLFPRPA